MSKKQSVTSAGSPARFEFLEDRRLLSASVSAGGTLSVGGGRRHDDIVITKNPSNPNQLRVTVNGEVEDFGGRIKRIAVIAGAGDDFVAIHRRVYTPTTIEGGAGDDSLYGGGGDDSINGDVGDDSIVGGSGRDNCHGGSGIDDIFGGIGDDSIYGEDGRDRVRGDDGDDLYDNNREVLDDDPNDHHRHGQDDPADHDINDDKGGLR